jgi:hypothetical protein
MNMLEAYIARIVTFLVTPLSVSASTAAAYYAQKWLGVDFDPTELSIYLTSVAVGQALVIYKWVSNRGQYEIAEVQGYINNLHQLGSEAAAQVPVDAPVVK